MRCKNPHANATAAVCTTLCLAGKGASRRPFVSIFVDWFVLSTRRTLPVMRGQGPVSNARRAAATARSTSSGCAAATSASFSPLAGFSVCSVAPDLASTNLLLMNSCGRAEQGYQLEAWITIFLTCSCTKTLVASNILLRRQNWPAGKHERLR